MKKLEIEVFINENTQYNDKVKEKFGDFIKGVLTSAVKTFPYSRISDKYSDKYVFAKAKDQFSHLFTNGELITITREKNGTIVVEVQANELDITSKDGVRKDELIKFLKSGLSDRVYLDNGVLKHLEPKQEKTNGGSDQISQTEVS